ncbi:MAG: DegV family protein [Pseudomonadota bacterium]
MISTHIDGNAFANAIVSGIHRVITEQEELNQINVFPVADGDTGTNLSLSLGYALPLLKQDDDKHLGTMLAALADALLDGARGNSGAIMAQFFQGMSDSAGEISRFTTYTFGKAVQSGSDYAHDALSNPREGTILSVIDAFAGSLYRQSIDGNEDKFSVVLGNAVEHIEKALKQTPEQLDVLKKAGVVDAGAKGFVALVAGLVDYLLHGRMHEEPNLSDLVVEDNLATAFDHGNSAYRFCTECIVTGTDIDRRKLREKLSEMGDSLVLAGTKRKAKVHIHVNDPDDVFQLAGQFGNVSGEKADDMHRQVGTTHNVERSFAVVVDSAADIPDEQLEQFDINVVPLRIQFGERGYLDKVSITPEEFFEELAENPTHPTTSQPAPGDFRRQFQFLASHYSDVLSINVTSKASGTLQAAEAASDRVNAHGEVHVLDSFNAATGQGMLAVRAAELAAAGTDVPTTLRHLEALRPETRTFALLNHLSYAVKGGRVPAWVKVIAQALRLTAILQTRPDGEIKPGGFLLGRHDRARRFARFVAKRSPMDKRLDISIAHAIAPEDADIMAEEFRRLVGDIRRLTISELGTAIGVHGGPGTLVVSTQPVDA